jgi:hypothetical protein
MDEGLYHKHSPNTTLPFALEMSESATEPLLPFFQVCLYQNPKPYIRNRNLMSYVGRFFIHVCLVFHLKKLLRLSEERTVCLRSDAQTAGL